jgi:hypothetical protein
MLTFDAVTTYAPRHWESHARRCAETFDRHWIGIDLLAMTDDTLEEMVPWLPAFKARHAHRPTDNYRFDAVRFSHKVAAIDYALSNDDADVLVWLDADCVTHAPVDAEWLSGFLGGADFGYLRRARKYPECGFMLLRRNDRVRTFWGDVVNLYSRDAIFDLREWHDSYAIEHVRAAHEAAGLLRCVSLSGDAENTGHPLVNGPLGAKLDHLKGKRKQAGRSHASDLVAPRTETYWSHALWRSATNRS